MMMNACTPKIVVSPVASSFSNVRSERIAVRRPAPTKSTNAISTAVAPNRPSSSAMAAKMKSLWTAGILVGVPSPRPEPPRPPLPIANRPWITW